MADIILTSSDGHEFGAYRADPDGTPRGAIVVIQEIFGVNSHIRSICDRLAALGYVAVAPAIFDRVERDFQTGYSQEDVARAREFIPQADWNGFIRDVDAARTSVVDAGRVGVVGFCLGGAIAFMAGTRLEGFSAAVGFYGGRVAAVGHEKPRCPTQLHYGSEDQGIPMSNVDSVRAQRPDCDVFVYQGADHGFNCDARASYNEEAAGESWGRTTDLFAKHIG